MERRTQPRGPLELHVVEGPDSGRSVRVGERLVVGREEDLGLLLSDEQASRRHAEFRGAEGRAVVEDLGSTNGTHVGEQPIHAPRRLDPGERVRIGKTVLELVDAGRGQGREATPAGPPVTRLGADVLRPAAPEELAPAEPPGTPRQPAPEAPGMPGLRAAEQRPRYVPSAIASGPGAGGEPEQLAGLADSRVKAQTGTTAIAILALAGLAVVAVLALL